MGMLQATEKHREWVEDKQEEKRNARSETKILELFHFVDKDGSGKLTRQEFENLITDPAYLLEFKDATELDKDTLAKLFDYLADHPEPDEDGEAKIKQKDFIDGLKNQSQMVTEKSIMRLEK